MLFNIKQTLKLSQVLSTVLEEDLLWNYIQLWYSN